MENPEPQINSLGKKNFFVFVESEKQRNKHFSGRKGLQRWTKNFISIYIFSNISSFIRMVQANALAQEITSIQWGKLNKKEIPTNCINQ